MSKRNKEIYILIYIFTHHILDGLGSLFGCPLETDTTIASGSRPSVALPINDPQDGISPPTDAIEISNMGNPLNVINLVSVEHSLIEGSILKENSHGINLMVDLPIIYRNKCGEMVNVSNVNLTNSVLKAIVVVANLPPPPLTLLFHLLVWRFKNLVDNHIHRNRKIANPVPKKSPPQTPPHPPPQIPPQPPPQTTPIDNPRVVLKESEMVVQNAELLKAAPP
ncbi:hypothetical protein IEQ34_016064 [Dendrobium chrysotoxum]|uniref:Uncharacterized protein n=1 Tax=Dendrobium chrysotoxum TaxID=161865 RepID=A0AAV7FWL3_DENCH|nr:hypothetical protein IEQ34_016064 [Dendrobium chrysotoxum]